MPQDLRDTHNGYPQELGQSILQKRIKNQGAGSVDPGPDPWCLWRQEADKYESDVAYVAFTRLVAPFCMITTALSLLQAGSPQVSLPLFVKPGIFHWILISFPIKMATFVYIVRYLQTSPFGSGCFLRHWML